MSTEVETKVNDVDIDLDEILGQPGNAMVESTAKEKSGDSDNGNVLTGDKDNEEFLNNLGKEDDDKSATDDEIDKMLEIKPEDDKQKPAGDPMKNAIQSLLESNILLGFDDDKDIKDYTEDDYKELIEANIKYQSENSIMANNQAIYDNLPPEMQAAMEYISSGGNDIKGMFRALSEVVETRDLNIDNVEDQKRIIREFYTMTNWGTPQDIDEEITSLQDKGDLKKKAQQFKPKLDANKQENINKRIENQRKVEETKRKKAQDYASRLYNTLNKDTLNGLPLSNEVRDKLYNGLTMANYSTMSGRATNMLGYLLEKYQWVEPRHDIIAEVLWHLADPEGYRNAITTNAEKKAMEKTMRQLKTEEQSSRKPSSQQQERVTPKLTRPNKGFFTR